MSRRRARRAGFVLVGALTFLTLVAAAQPRKSGRGRPRPKSAATKVEAGAPEARPETPHAEPPNAPHDAGASSTAGGVVSETSTKDGGARVFRFGEVEVEGRLKSPQIVYFLRRVRAEFAAGDLGHRSFQGELLETRREPGF